MINPYRTMKAKDWDFRSPTLYKTNKTLLLLDEANDAQMKFLEAIERSTEDFEWAWSDSVMIDENYTAYLIDYNESDTVIMDGWVLGRKMIEDGELDIDEILEIFINVNNRALPSWITPPKSWTERSCDFQAGMYDRYDDPKVICKQLNEDGFDVLFQIDTVSPFAVDYCVWVKEK